MSNEYKLSNSERVLNFELTRSKSHATWGKEIIFAIDANNPAKLISIFKKKKHLGANINEQTTRRSYGGYAWTHWMHKFLGDTALHIALKQRKTHCVHALLVIGADTNIANDEGLFPDDIALKVYGKTLKQLRQASEADLLDAMHPRDFHLLPDNVLYRNLEHQAQKIMEGGRCMYTQLPKCLVSSIASPSSIDEDTLTNVEDGMSVENCGSVDSSSAGYLQAVKTKHQSSMSMLSSMGSASGGIVGKDNPHRMWVFDNVTDVVDFLIRQNQLIARLDHEERLRESGLSLLADKEVEDTMAPSLTKMSQLMYMEAKKSLNSYSMLEKIVSLDQGESAPPKEYIPALDMPYRHVTKLSTRTNMIHMKIGDKGMQKISKVLAGNTIISDIVLANARITSVGLQYLADAMLFLPNLKYLDLSQNAIDDVGAEALAYVLESVTVVGDTSNVKRITLMGNRITHKGARALVMAVLNGNVEYLKNRISPSHVTELQVAIDTFGKSPPPWESVDEKESDSVERVSVMMSDPKVAQMNALPVPPDVAVEVDYDNERIPVGGSEYINMNKQPVPTTVNRNSGGGGLASEVIASRRAKVEEPKIVKNIIL